MKRSAILLCALMAIITVLSACTDESAGKALRYDIPSPVVNLDPLFATDPTARMILANIGEGLVRLKPDGTVVPGAAEMYTLSPDGTTYTFHLRKDAGWAGREFRPVTAGDFVFAFRRMFTGGGQAQSASPYVRDYLLIKNAAEVLEGGAHASALGIRAVDEHTLTITLEHPSPLFIERLADIAAMPCNPDAFGDTRGRYGLEKQFTMANGPFYLEGWTDKQLILRPNPNYGGERHTASPAIYLYVSREDTLGRFFSNSTDFSQIPFNYITRAGGMEKHVTAMQTTTWCIVFNQNDPIWGNPFLRQSLALSADRGLLDERLPGNFSLADHLIPPATTLMGRSFRGLAVPDSPLAFESAKASRLFGMGLDALGLSELPATDLYVPDGGGHAVLMGFLQQGWQGWLDTYINIVAEPPHELEERFAAGDFQLLLMPFTPGSRRVEALPLAFDEQPLQNRLGYRNPRLRELILMGQTADDPEETALRFSQAERLLLADAVVIPVYNEFSYFAMGRDVTGIEAYPFGGEVWFKDGFRQ